MVEKTAARTDLFGDPWTPPRDPRGRKRHKRLAQVAEKIAVLRASGLTVEQITVLIGLSEPTLRQYYFRELEHGSKLARAVLVGEMWDKAKAGVVGAARFIREEFDKGEAAVPLARKRAGAPAEPKEAKLGKKEQLDRDAASAHEGTGWGNLLKH